GDRELGEGETVELPLRRERLVVQKEPLAAEDVVISKKLQVRNDQVEGTVREEQLAVDDPLGVAEIQPEAPYCPLPAREGPVPAKSAPAAVAPSPLGYYRPEGPVPAALDGEGLTTAPADVVATMPADTVHEEQDNEPTERLLRPSRYQTHMYDPEPH